LFTGCRNDGLTKFGVAKTRGRVLCEGKPVPFATVFFEPKQVTKNATVGKQGIGMADKDGNFTITTYDTNDGAVIGKHSVKVIEPLGDNRKGFTCECLLLESTVVMEVDIVAGQDNNVEIALGKPTPEQLAAAKKAAAKKHVHPGKEDDG
jgi:hypothetical protein